MIEEFQAEFMLVRKEMKDLAMKMKEELKQKDKEIEDLRRNEEKQAICKDKMIEELQVELQVALEQVMKKTNDRNTTELKEELIQMDKHGQDGQDNEMEDSRKDEEKQAVCKYGQDYKDVNNIFEAIFNLTKK